MSKEALEIIDFERKGNILYFALGKNGEQWGDDWDDAPYEYNAGQAYDEYIKGACTIAIDFKHDVYEPRDGAWNSQYSKEDMIQRRVPCIIVVPNAVGKDSYHTDFIYWLGHDKAITIYFGDKITEIIDKLNRAKVLIPIVTKYGWGDDSNETDDI